MKVLFVLLHPGHIGIYGPVIEEMLSRRHEVTLSFNSFNKYKKDGFESLITEKLKEFSRYPQLQYSLDTSAPTRSVVSNSFVKQIRCMKDYVRYWEPLYDSAYKLRRRAGKMLWPVSRLGLFLIKLYYGGDLKRINALIDRMERAVPVDKGIADFLVKQNPDVVLITPLVDFGSEQTDYVKAARHLGKLCVLCVHSWDNLTNKGMIRIVPDHVVVWNEFQKEEAVTMHGVRPEQVIVTGAQCYDHWFSRKPTIPADDFCAKVGLPGEKEYILYLCSSPFIAPREVAFVKEWVQALRTSSDERLKKISILIRPHPQNAKQWQGVCFDGRLGVALWPRGGALPFLEPLKQDYYHTLFYARAVVGINSSAMVEASILGKPVLTIVDEHFKATQEGTIHFRYLKDNGPSLVADSLDAHMQQLGKVLSGEIPADRIRKFVQAFIRPRGIDFEVTPVFVDEIEKVVQGVNSCSERKA